jgi:Tfp pilus assembly protein PilN
MPIQAGDGKTAVAVFVDGLELKFVRLSAKGNKVTLRDFKTVALVHKFEEKQATPEESESTAFGDIGGGDAFAAAGAIESTGDEGTTNASVLLGLLNDLGSPKKYSLSYAISEPAVTYQEFESNFGLKGEKLKKKLSQELSMMRASAPALDAIDTIPSASGGLLSLIREDGLHVYELLSEVKPFMGGHVPLIKIMDSADAALMEMVRTQYEPQEEEVSVLVYVGHDFSRLVFMQGEHYLHFAPIISEGYESPNIENTIYSRILLEQDNIALTRIDRILLAGESHKVNLLDTLAPQFSSALVEYMKAPNLDIGEFEGSIGESISEYVIPIMTAWRALQPKLPGFYDINLVPSFILEGQRTLALAWHGILAALIVCLTIPFFFLSITDRQTEIRRLGGELAQKQQKLTELDIFRQRRAVLSSDISRYSNATSIYDSIAPGSDRWSRILHYLANSVEDLNSLWIYSLKPDDKDARNILISGRAIYRSRIPRIASIFEKATLREVRTITIRKKILYEFDIIIEKVDKFDIPEPNYTGTK